MDGGTTKYKIARYTRADSNVHNYLLIKKRLAKAVINHNF